MSALIRNLAAVAILLLPQLGFAHSAIDALEYDDFVNVTVTGAVAKQIFDNIEMPSEIRSQRVIKSAEQVECYQDLKAGGRYVCELNVSFLGRVGAGHVVD